MTDPGADLVLLEPADALIRAVVELSQRFGRDPEYSRGGGGNSSLKAGGVVYIKPSGVPLATLEAEDLVPLATGPLLELLLHGGSEAEEARLPDAPDPVMRAAARVRLADARGRRPSVELMFHSLIPERFVLHTHPIVPNAVTCNEDGEAIMGRLFGDDALWVPYTDPGLPLARRIHELREAFAARTGRAGAADHVHGQPRHHRLGRHRPRRWRSAVRTSWAPSAPSSGAAASSSVAAVGQPAGWPRTRPPTAC